MNDILVGKVYDTAVEALTSHVENLRREIEQLSLVETEQNQKISAGLGGINALLTAHLKELMTDVTRLRIAGARFRNWAVILGTGFIVSLLLNVFLAVFLIVGK